MSRFDGLDLDYPNATLRSCKNGIRCINLPTAINTRWLGSLDAANLQRLAGAGVGSMACGNGTIFVAAEAPQIGDVAKSLMPAEYVFLGNTVAPLRVDYRDWLFEPPPGLVAPDGFAAAYATGRVEHDDLARYYFTQQWMARFDG